LTIQQAMSPKKTLVEQLKQLLLKLSTISFVIINQLESLYK